LQLKIIIRTSLSENELRLYVLSSTPINLKSGVGEPVFKVFVAISYFIKIFFLAIESGYS